MKNENVRILCAPPLAAALIVALRPPVRLSVRIVARITPIISK